MEAWQATVQDEFGNVVFNPQITVYESDGVTLASIYNEDGSPKANPFTGSLEGFAQFWAGPGVYKIRGANGGQTELWESDLGSAKIMPYQPFENRAEAEVASIPSSVQYINVAGLQYVRDPSGTALETEGGVKWSPVGTVTPQHFGAMGDNTNNDAPAFQAALNYASSVFVPPAMSNYYCAEPLVLNSNQHLYGDSFNVAKLRFKDTNGLVSGDGNQNVRINDLQLNGNGGADTIGIHIIGNERRTHIDSVRCYDFGRDNSGGGIVLQDSDYGGVPAGDMWGAYITNCNIEYCGRGIALLDVRAVVLVGNISRLCYGTPLYMDDCVAVTSIGGAHENSNSTSPGGVSLSWGAHLKNSRGITLDGFDCENLVNGLVLLDNCRSCDIDLHGGTAEAGATMISLINGSSNNSISGATGGMWNAGHTGVNLNAGCNDNEIEVLFGTEGTNHASATLYVDNGTRNTLRLTRGVGGINGRYRKTPADDSGTFTPSLLFGGGNTGMAGTFTGQYVRQGALVFVTVNISLTAKGESAGIATVDLSDIGITPFGPSAGSMVSYFNMSGVGGAPIVGFPSSSPVGYIRVSTATGSLSMTESAFTDTTSFLFTMVFKTA